MLPLVSDGCHRFSDNFVGGRLGSMAPTMMFRTFIPLYPVAGSWIRVSARVVIVAHWLTKAQEGNGRFHAILWSPCHSLSGKGSALWPLKREPDMTCPRGQNFTLQPTDYIIGPASGNPNLCLTWPRASQPTPDGVDWQLGTFCNTPPECVPIPVL